MVFKKYKFLLVGLALIISSFIVGPAWSPEVLTLKHHKLQLLLQAEFIALGLFFIFAYLKNLSTRQLINQGILLVPVFLYLGLGFWRLWVCDDAFITFRIVRNFISGNGPVFNIGARVEVYSHPVWFTLLALGDWLSGEIEIVAAWLGLILSVLGLSFGLLGTRRLLIKIYPDKNLIFIPLGGLIVATLPPFWTFASSGLETGLGFFWLGVSFWLFTTRTDGESFRNPIVTLVWISLGPLIRPDFIIFYVGMVLLVFLYTKSLSVSKIINFIIAAALLPLLYQIFRMGYFASLFSNTTLAKSATSSYWSQGLLYLKDFVLPYKLYVPLVLMVIAFVIELLPRVERSHYRHLFIMVSFIALGFLHAFFVIRGGGDFMHARFLLPGFFMLQLPLSCIALKSRAKLWQIISLIILMAGLTAWSIWTIGWARLSYKDIGPDEIADERGYYVKRGKCPNPIVVEDYDFKDKSLPKWQKLAEKAKELSLYERKYMCHSGMAAFSMGPEWYIFLGGGLADPIAARFTVETRGRPGHEKKLPEAWGLARLSPCDEMSINEIIATSHSKHLAGKLYAMKVLRAPIISKFLKAIQAPLTTQRFIQNIAVAVQTSSLEIPKDPYDAVQKFCHSIPPWMKILKNPYVNDTLLVLLQNDNSPTPLKYTNLFNDLNNGTLTRFKLNPLEKNAFVIATFYIGQTGEDEHYELHYCFSPIPIKRNSLPPEFASIFQIQHPDSGGLYYPFNRDLDKDFLKIFEEPLGTRTIQGVDFKSTTKILFVKKFSSRDEPIIINTSNLTFEDCIDIGHRNDEQRHRYRVSRHTGQGEKNFAYPNGITKTDDGRGWLGFEKFTIHTTPYKPLVIIKRFDIGRGTQTVDVSLVIDRKGDEKHLGRWKLAGDNQPGRWREKAIIIPAKYINDRKITLKFSHVASETEVNSFFYWFYSIDDEEKDSTSLENYLSVASPLRHTIHEYYSSLYARHTTGKDMLYLHPRIALFHRVHRLSPCLSPR